MAYMRLGDLLVASGTITGQQLERALALQKETKQRLGDALIQNGFITEAQLIDALRVQLGVDFVDLTAISIPVELAQYVPRNIAKKYCVVPVKLVRNSLYLAMSDPLDFVAQDEVKTASRKRIIPMIATRKAVEQAISRLCCHRYIAPIISYPHAHIQVCPLVDSPAGRKAVDILLCIVDRQRKGADFDVVIRVKFAICIVSGSQIPTELIL